MIYADYNATAPLRPEARAAMVGALGSTANPSSVHGPGRGARKRVETARGQIGGAIGSRAEDIVFTSGGTEANTLALHGAIAAHTGPVTLLVSAIEHEAVTQNAGTTGAPVRSVYARPDGRIDLDHLETMLAGWDADVDGIPFLALMLVNNETGVIQPVAEAAVLVRAAGGLTHCDAVQALGKIPVNVALLGADYLALSAHKIGGPQGVGALWHRAGAPLKPLQLGGGQERSIRSGTENVPGIAGFGAAAEAAVRDIASYGTLADLRDAMEARLVADAGISVMGHAVERVAGTSCFALEGFRAETQVMAMDLAGIAVSSGAACSSGKVKRSVVLSAMGVTDGLADAAIRLSFGWDSDPSDFDAVAEAWLKAARRVRPTAQGSAGPS
ncbi:MAG: cysteine desulfurase family protein [Pseudomonadota bacterium]